MYGCIIFHQITRLIHGNSIGDEPFKISANLYVGLNIPGFKYTYILFIYPQAFMIKTVSPRVVRLDAFYWLGTVGGGSLIVGKVN